MKKKVLIIDDENRTRDFVKKMIDSFNLDLDVFTDGENVETGIEAINRIQPDILLLDIQMPDGTGFDVLNSIETKNFEVIFITAYQEYAIKAIKFSALDYILKPIDSEELHSSIITAIDSLEFKREETKFIALENNIQPNNRRKLVLKTQECIYVVDLNEIIRCEADKNYTFFYLNSGKKILVSRTLKDYETILNGYGFFRIQQSHLINLEYLDRYDKQQGGAVIMKDGTSVPLSPAKKDQFFKLLEKL
jgi:two-component system, LytTR family, response regulator